MSKKIGAIITCGDFQGLGVLRTLAKKSIPTIIIDHENCISRYSKYKSKFYRAPSPSDEESYVQFLCDLAAKEDIDGWVIIPITDNTVRVFSKHKEILGRYFRVPIPSWDVIRNVYIKAQTYKIAEKNGIPVPKTYYPDSLDELLTTKLEYPLVIKPSIRDNFYDRVKIKAFRINNVNELKSVYNRVSSIIDSSEIIIQELIPGGADSLYSFCPFFKDGKVVANVMAKRSRQHPMDFGHASTFAETVNIPEIQKISVKFLKLINFYGIGEVEFMYDARFNEYKLIEVNPRIWGWHTLAIAAGVDLPYLMYQDMIGESIHTQPAREDLKWIRLVTDIPTVTLEIFKRNMKIKDYFASMRGNKEFAVFSFSDPLPFFAEIAMIPYLWIKRGF